MGQQPTETLESAGDRWKGTVEWSADRGRSVRHWWRVNSDAPAFTHRASGEQIAYAGRLEETNWHRFEYRHGETLYPIAVEMKQVRWPNPYPDRYAGPPYNGGLIPELRLPVWRVDHVRSARLWQVEEWSSDRAALHQVPPYWLWRRVDHAITDVALLWPKTYHTEVEPALEVAINGGWLNGEWCGDFFRRIRRHDDFGDAWDQIVRLSQGPSPASLLGHERGLPLTDHCLEDVDVTPPRWERARGSGLDLYGIKTYGQTLMRNVLDGTVISAAAGSLVHLERGLQPAYVVLGNGIAWAVPHKVEGRSIKYGERPDHDRLLEIASNWTALMNWRCSVTLQAGSSEGISRFGKPVVSFDGMGGDARLPYQLDGISHPLSTYRSWRFLHDCFLNALLFSPGFAAEDHESQIVQGDFGQVKIMGGFIGGISGLVTELRTKLELPTDGENTTWSRFFS